MALLEVDCTDEPLDIFFETIQEEALSQSEKDLGYEKMSDEDFTDFALDSIMIDYDPKPVRYPGTEKLLQNLLKTLQKNPSKALPELTKKKMRAANCRSHFNHHKSLQVIDQTMTILLNSDKPR